MITFVLGVFCARDFFSQNTRANCQNDQRQGTESADVEETPRRDGKSVDDDPHALLSKNVGVASVGEQTLSEETALVVGFERGIARTGAVFAVLENPLLLVGDSFDEEHDQEGASDHPVDGSGGASRVGGKNQQRKSFCPEENGLEQGDEEEAEKLPNNFSELGVSEHVELADDFPTIIFTTVRVTTSAIKVECHS